MRLIVSEHLQSRLCPVFYLSCCEQSPPILTVNDQINCCRLPHKDRRLVTDGRLEALVRAVWEYTHLQDDPRIYCVLRPRISRRWSEWVSSPRCISLHQDLLLCLLTRTPGRHGVLVPPSCRCYGWAFKPRSRPGKRRRDGARPPAAWS